jgi:apolipoprotein N-acyltransferase
MKLSKLGLCGIISLLSYTASVVFSPLAYPGYHWMSMAVSELSAVGAPSKALAEQLICLFSPCGLVSIMAVCVAASNWKTKSLRLGVYLFAAMEWVCGVGYDLFPWVSNAVGFNFQNLMHLIVTAAVVGLSIASLLMIAVAAKKEGQKSLGIWAAVCLAAMFGGAIGSNLLPAAVFGIAERFSTFSAVIFNAVLGYYLFSGRLDKKSEKAACEG